MTPVAARSWFHCPRRLAISQAASSRRGQLDQRVREHTEDQFQVADVELESERRALEAEEESLGSSPNAAQARIASSPALAWISARTRFRCSAANGIRRRR